MCWLFRFPRNHRGVCMKILFKSLSIYFLSKKYALNRSLFTFSQTVVSDCGKYLILAIVKDCRDNIIYYADLIPGEDIKSELDVKVIIDKFESDYDVSILEFLIL